MLLSAMVNIDQKVVTERGKYKVKDKILFLNEHT